MKPRSGSTALIVAGWREWVRLPELVERPIKAKLDTGARTSVLHAWDVEIDGPIVRFRVHPIQRDDTVAVPAAAPLAGHREVRSSNGMTAVRPVIVTPLVIGERRFSIELTLTARDEMGFRLLLGRTALRHHALVDPGRSFLTGRP